MNGGQWKNLFQWFTNGPDDLEYWQKEKLGDKYIPPKRLFELEKKPLDPFIKGVYSVIAYPLYALLWAMAVSMAWDVYGWVTLPVAGFGYFLGHLYFQHWLKRDHDAFK